MAYDPRGIDVTRKLKHDGIVVLSHAKRKDAISIFSLNILLTHDICDRIHDDTRMQDYELACPHASNIKDRLKEIEHLAVQTVSSRMIILDVFHRTYLRLGYYLIMAFSAFDERRAVRAARGGRPFVAASVASASIWA
jgi:hypothetical protein